MLRQKCPKSPIPKGSTDLNIIAAFRTGKMQTCIDPPESAPVTLFHLLVWPFAVAVVFIIYPSAIICMAKCLLYIYTLYIFVDCVALSKEHTAREILWRICVINRCVVYDLCILFFTGLGDHSAETNGERTEKNNNNNKKRRSNNNIEPIMVKWNRAQAGREDNIAAASTTTATEKNSTRNI